MDVIYYWEISTLQLLLKREIVPANTALATWFHEDMKRVDGVSQLEQKSLEAIAAYSQTTSPMLGR